MSRLTGLIAVSVLGAFATAPASAATQTLCGPNICYEYDDAQAAVALFGLPSLSGNALVFTPANFRAQSTDGQAVNGLPGVTKDTANANFIFTDVYSLDGMSEVENIIIVEFGDYEIDNGDDVEADLLLTVINNTPLGFVPEIGSSSASFDAFGDSGGLQTWMMQTNFNASEEFEASAQSVQLTIQNTLGAETNAVGEDAWIQKKVTVLGVVPIPAAAWLFLSGLGALVGMRRFGKAA